MAPAAWSGFTIHQTLDTLYGARDRELRDTVSSGGTAYAVTQHSWDPLGRPLTFRGHYTDFTSDYVCE